MGERSILRLLITACVGLARGGTVSYTFDIRGWIVDYQRPTITPRVSPHNLPLDAVANAILANNSFPGPVVEAYVGDTIEVTVVNNLIDAQVDLQWEGVDVLKQPSSPILQQGGQFKYVMSASKAGTFWWHSRSSTQAASGLKGALVIRIRNDPSAQKYQEEVMMALADARQRPEVCFSAEGVLFAACPEIEKATLNGQWGDGSKGWPSPLVEVQEGKCYRLRFIGIASAQPVTFKVTVERHKLELLRSGSTGSASEVEVRTGDSVDAILCANQQSMFKHEFEIKMEYVGASGSKTFSATLRYTSKDAAAQESLKSVAKKEAEFQQPPKSMVNDESKFDPSQCEVHQYFDLREQIVDYLRPTVDLGGKASRKPVDQIPLPKRKDALLVNNSYPGPVVEAIEGQLVCVTVMNNFETDPVAIHWHGQHMKGFPAFDGVYGVHQGAITPGSSMTYRWRANAGTHLWHGHMQALQADKGMKGPIVIHAKNDPHKHLYDEELIVALSDEWVNPGVCLRKEGAQPGNPVCAEIEKATWNGVWGDGSDEYPWPMVTVAKGKCYRLRFIGMMGQAQNFQISIAGHDMTLIAVDGADVEPVKVSMFNLHAGERADVVICANQEPGNYLMSANYDLANFLETAPAPKMPRVDSSKYWAFLNYAGHTDKPGHASKKLFGGYKPPAGTGGGLSPKPSSGFAWDTNLQSAWGKVKNLNAVTEPEKADVTYTLNVGIAHPAFTPGVTPYATSDRMYMFTDIRPWKKPETPLLHTKGECGAEGVPYITVPENATTVEVILNNLSPTAHVLHMHGMRFSVINYAPFSESWCSNAHFECFFIPISVARLLDCKRAVLGDNASDGPGSEYWGCPYDPASDVKSQNLQNPLQKDMISLWRRSWAVIRFKVDNPGVWLLHCHMEQHIPTGQIMAFSLLPSKQPPIPSDVPSEGPCPIWSGRDAPLRPPKRSQFFV